MHLPDFTRSLHFRLIAGFVSIATLLLIVMGVVLCYRLDDVLSDYDETEVRVAVTRALRQTNSLTTEAALVAHIESAMAQGAVQGRASLAVVNHFGHVIYTTPGLTAPTEALRRALLRPETHVHQWQNQSGTSWVGAFEHVRLPGEAEPTLLAAVLDRSETGRVLSTVTRYIVWIIVLGIALLALAGVFLVRQALRPLNAVASAAKRIDAEQLASERLSSDRAPPELRDLTLAFNGMLDRLALSFRQLREFSADLAHELRTPINNLLGTTQVALSRPRSTTQYQETLGSNAEELSRLHHMTEDMLFLASTDHAQVPLNQEEFCLYEECSKVASFLEVVAEEKSLAVHVAGESTLTADRRLVQRALYNLFANALRHAPAKSVVNCEIQTAGGDVRVSIANQGEPIAPDDQGRIFDRFYRVDKSRTGSQNAHPNGSLGPVGGTGLGLSIVKSIMNLHHGRVWVESSAALGTRFFLQFPQTAPSAQTPHSAT